MSDILIVFFSIQALICALLVLLMRQPMRAALSLVWLMISLAAVYACLGAHVVAVFQVLIYVGAVMVFMVYTIMLLDERDASYRTPFSRLIIPAVAVATLFVAVFGRLAGQMNDVKVADPGVDLLSFSHFSQVFMQKYWFHFELATVLLLVGILAAWAVLKEGRHG